MNPFHYNIKINNAHKNNNKNKSKKEKKKLEKSNNSTLSYDQYNTSAVKMKLCIKMAKLFDNGNQVKWKILNYSRRTLTATG